MLPAIEPGDIMVFHDTGAYTMGMWSRQPPAPTGLADDARPWACLQPPEGTIEAASSRTVYRSSTRALQIGP
ncbi:MAG: hypothetical protein ACI8PZ_006141 [Myxococcota bacterium]|jgi:hypothetical protein